MLIGDAANQADPLNGGGIHKAMESAWCAAEACRAALAAGDFSAPAWGATGDSGGGRRLDWRTAEIFLSIAKNPSLRDFCLFLLGQIGRLSTRTPSSRSSPAASSPASSPRTPALAARASLPRLPKDRAAGCDLLRASAQATGRIAAGTFNLTASYLANAARAAVSMAKDPIANMDWGLDLATKAAWLAQNRLAGRPLAGGERP